MMPDARRRRDAFDKSDAPERSAVDRYLSQKFGVDKKQMMYRQIWPELAPDSPVANALETMEAVLDFPATYDEVLGAIMGSPFGKPMTVQQVEAMIYEIIDQNKDDLVTAPEYLRYVMKAKQLMAEAGRDLSMPNDVMASGAVIRQGSSLLFAEISER